MKFVAHTVKGIEQIALEELQSKIPDIVVEEVDVKKIQFESKTLLNKVPTFHTLDDISLYITEFNLESIDGTDIFEKLGQIDFEYFFSELGRVRNLNKTFSITISTFKNNDVDKEVIKNELGQNIKDKYELEFTPLDHTNFDIRLNIERKICYVYIKVFPQSLFFRDYRIESQKGALRPSIAGAMLLHLTKGKGGMKVIDNFCGSGTFLCEALLTKNDINGGDISKESVLIAKNNIKQINPNKVINIKTQDATKTKWLPNTYDVAVSNLPWNKQISVSHITELYSKAIKEYARILKQDASIAFIGYKPDLMKKYLKKEFPQEGREIHTMKIGYLGQSPTIVFCTINKTNKV
jgi:23S rRNA G2445 N2-methylase RlmL